MLTSLRRLFNLSTTSRTHTRRCSAHKAPPPRRLELEGLEQRFVLSPISDKYFGQLGGYSGVLGPPIGPEQVCPDNIGHFQYFQNGAIYWSPSTQAHDVIGPILSKWGSMGWERSILGYPTYDYSTTGRGDGKFNYFQGGLIEWSPATGVSEIHGPILQEFAKMGYEGGPLGYPTSDVLNTVRNTGNISYFQNGVILWSQSTGAHEVQNVIWDEYAHMGYEQGILGFPTTDESGTPDGIGRYNHFQGGSIYWTWQTGAHEVHGEIGYQWASMGWERNPLGYPISDEMNAEVPADRMQFFQNGEIHYQPYPNAEPASLILIAYKLNDSTVRFCWQFYGINGGFDGFLVSAHPTGTFTQVDVGGGGYSGSYDVNAYAGSTYSFSIDPYVTVLLNPRDYIGWYDPLIWTVT
jgi:uncharacterized protein with LGFP repeats